MTSVHAAPHPTVTVACMPTGAVPGNAAVDGVRAGLEIDLARLRPLRHRELEPAELRVGEQQGVRSAEVVVLHLGDPGWSGELLGLERQRRQHVDLESSDRRTGGLLEPARRLTRLFAGPEREDRPTARGP